MPGPHGPASNRGQPVSELDHRELAPTLGPAVPDDDRFAAVFAAARGTVSRELDLNGILDDPGATSEDGDVEHRRAGS